MAHIVIISVHNSDFTRMPGKGWNMIHVIYMIVIISDLEVDIVTLSYPLYMTISALIGKVTPI